MVYPFSGAPFSALQEGGAVAMSNENPAVAVFDPISLEILWSRLISIADESAAALLRTSFSTIVRESNDFATGLMDANGDSSASCPAL
jgi:hypothetical protein